VKGQNKMCEFVSWIEKDGTLVYLTGEDVFNTKRGKELQEYCIDLDDLSGHGAIRWYYNFEGGKNFECTDFSAPDNFPAEIVEVIKSGKMRGMGLSKQLLTKPALAEYNKIQQLARAEYNKIEQPAWAEYSKIEQLALAEYNKIQQLAWAEYSKIEQLAWAEYNKIQQLAWAEYSKIKQLAWAEYNKIKQLAWAEYNKIKQPAWAEYNKIKQPAWAEYNKIKQLAFWDLFAESSNRNKKWR